MRMAFADAGIEPDDVDYVNAHGTSTPSGDAAETRVLKLALGEEKAFRTPVSSTKGATGHCLGAAGAIEAIFTTFALQQGVLPPTINYETPDPECDLDYIPNEARRQHIEVAVNNSFGFGGHNACVVLRRWDDGAYRAELRLQHSEGPSPAPWGAGRHSHAPGVVGGGRHRTCRQPTSEDPHSGAAGQLGLLRRGRRTQADAGIRRPPAHPAEHGIRSYLGRSSVSGSNSACPAAWSGPPAEWMRIIFIQGLASWRTGSCPGPRVVFTGRMHPQKNLPLLLEAWVQVADRTRTESDPDRSW